MAQKVEGPRGFGWNDEKRRLLKQAKQSVAAWQKAEDEGLAQDPNWQPKPFRAPGKNGDIIVTPQTVTIDRGPSEMSLPIESITGIELKNEFSIRFHYIGRSTGSMEGVGGIEIGGLALGWQNTENEIYFFMYHQPYYTKVKQLIQKYQTARANPPTATQPVRPDLADLEKLADLRDKGIISDDEFQAKKTQILGL